MEVRVDTPAADSERTMDKLEAILNWRDQANALVDGVASEDETWAERMEMDYRTDDLASMSAWIYSV
jgi:hypothetical protein